MKNLLSGMKRAKARTVLSVLIALIMTIAIALCANMAFSPTKQNRDFNAYDMHISQSTDDETQTAENDNNTQQEIDTTDETIKDRPATANSKARVNTVWIIASVIILIAGIVLLFAVNFISTKKRTTEFLKILSSSIPFGIIKKQLFLEAFVVVLIAGLIGSGVGIAISKPVSNAVMTKAMNPPDESFNMNDDTDKAFDEDFMNGEFKGEKPQGDFDFENPPENFDKGNRPEMPQRTDNADEADDENNDMQQFRGNGENNNSGYIISAVSSLVSAVIFAVISGVACYSPVKKIKSKETVNE